MSRDIRELRGAVAYMENRTSIMDPRLFNRSSELRHHLNEVKNLINMAESNKQRVGDEIEITDEPIAKVVYPGTSDVRDGNTWNEYNAWFTNTDGLFHIEAKQSIVTRVSWVTDSLIEVTLEHIPSKFMVTPLQNVEEGARNDEVQRGDVVILAGHYLIVAVPDQEGNGRGPGTGGGLIMTNFLKVQSAEEQNFSRRGANRATRTERRIHSVFR
jgi:hypothetical protein